MISVILKTQPNDVMRVGLIFWAASQYSKILTYPPYHTLNSNVNNKEAQQFFRLEKISEQLNCCQFQVNKRIMSEKNNTVPQCHPDSEDISYKFSSRGSG